MNAQSERRRRREEKLCRLWSVGVRDSRVLAAELGVTDRSVCRMLVNLKLRPPQIRPDYSPQFARLARLAEEGMPAVWIAEDTDLAYSTAQRHAAAVPGHDEAVREWQRVWQQIRRDERLLALHYEIAPPTLAEQMLRVA